MTHNGILHKMRVELASPVEYRLHLGDEPILMNDLIGKSIQLNFLAKITCIHCNKVTNKSFNQGYCYPCFKRLARCDRCIMSPELCHFQQGTCREPEWGESHCMQPHVVYLANSSGIKVGITRQNQIPTRWIDQGAIQALPFIQVDSRYHSGLIEVLFKQHVADKTNWRNMLKNHVEPIDLQARADELFQACLPQLDSLTEQGFHWQRLLDQQVTDIHYPVLTYPQKVSSLSLDKTAVVAGTVHGIKGQYLILDTGVINIRKFTGYHVSLCSKEG